MIFWQLFLSFFEVGLFSIGGGYAAMPLIQSLVVERYGWITQNEFTDLITIAEMTPGPITVNSATFVGIRIAGIPGALVATFGCILPACFIVSLLAYLYYRFKGLPAMENVLSCLRPVVVALITSAGLSILYTAVLGKVAWSAQSVNWVNLVLCAGAFFVLRKWKKNPILVMCACGGVSLAVNTLLMHL